LWNRSGAWLRLNLHRLSWGLTLVGFAIAFELVVLAWSAARRGITEAVVGSYAYNDTRSRWAVRPLILRKATGAARTPSCDEWSFTSDYRTHSARSADSQCRFPVVRRVFGFRGRCSGSPVLKGTMLGSQSVRLKFGYSGFTGNSISSRTFTYSAPFSLNDWSD
jgi:hypothetical protein